MDGSIDGWVSWVGRWVTNHSTRVAPRGSPDAEQARLVSPTDQINPFSRRSESSLLVWKLWRLLCNIRKQIALTLTAAIKWNPCGVKRRKRRRRREEAESEREREREKEIERERLRDCGISTSRTSTRAFVRGREG